MNDAPVDFTVIGGFLGSGKTSLVNRLLAASGSTRFAVLVNDFGALNIDEALIRHQDGRIMQLANGCICCSLAGGLVDTMVELMRYRHLIDHILIEASGVSYPSRIMDFARIDPDLRPGLTLVLVDAAHLQDHSTDTRLAETITAQMESADMFVLTKTDIASADMAAWSRDWVATRAPDAPIIEGRPDDASLVALITGPAPDATSAATHHHHPADHTGHHAHTNPDRALHTHFVSRAMTASRPVDEDGFADFANRFSKHLLRGKGTLHFHRRSAIWQQAGRLVHLEDATLDADTASQIVMISADDLSEAAAALRALGFQDVANVPAR